MWLPVRVGEEPEASKTGGAAPRERVGEEPEASKTGGRLPVRVDEEPEALKNRGMAPRESGRGARGLKNRGCGSP